MKIDKKAIKKKSNWLLKFAYNSEFAEQTSIYLIQYLFSVVRATRQYFCTDN